MTPTPDIFLEKNSTRVVDRLQVTTTDTPKTRRISVEPQAASVTVHSAESGGSEPGYALYEAGGQQAASNSISFLESKGGTGRLDVGDESGITAVRFGVRKGEGRYEVRRGKNRQATVGGFDDGQRAGGGVVTLYDDDEQEAVVMKAKRATGENAAGQVKVKNEGGETGVRIGGDDAVLELTGASASRSGGDLFVRRWPKGSQRGSPAPKDIHVHATADDVYDYGDRTQNPPRIYLDGPTATVELGRGRIDDARPGKRGRFKLRVGMASKQNTMVEGGVEQPNTAPGNRRSELLLRRNYAGSLTMSGAVRSSSEGLGFYNGGSTETRALLIRNNGSVETVNPIQKGSLPKVGPELVHGGGEAFKGNVAEIPLLAGDEGSMDWKIVDPNGKYEIRGTIDRSQGTDVRLTLQFDTGEAGNPGTRPSTVTLSGDWNLTVNHETRLGSQLSTGSYDLMVSDKFGTAFGTVLVK